MDASAPSNESSQNSHEHEFKLNQLDKTRLPIDEWR